MQPPRYHWDLGEADSDLGGGWYPCSHLDIIETWGKLIQTWVVGDIHAATWISLRPGRSWFRPGWWVISMQPPRYHWDLGEADSDLGGGWYPCSHLDIIETWEKLIQTWVLGDIHAATWISLRPGRSWFRPGCWVISMQPPRYHWDLGEADSDLGVGWYPYSHLDITETWEKLTQTWVLGDIHAAT